jgi:hypothetical protein
VTENTLPFSPTATNLIIEEVVDSTVEKADLYFAALMEAFDEIDDGSDRGVLTLHLWHLLSRDLMIEHGVRASEMISAVRKVAREARPAIKVRNFIAKVVAEE